MEAGIVKVVLSCCALLIHKVFNSNISFHTKLSDLRDSLGIRNSGSIKQLNGMEELGH